jgi:VWFA-related protein
VNRAVLAVIASLAVGIPRGQVFHSLADAVRVDVLVTEGRHPVGGLTAADFELRDSGVPQTIDDMQIQEVPFSMMLALDTSSSMGGPPLQELQDAARAAIDALRPGDRAALLTFGEVVSAATPWDGDHASLLSAIRDLGAGGSTSLFDAALAAVVQRDPERGRRNLLIVFTDGADTASWLPDFAALDLVTRTDIVVYGLAMGATPPRPAGLQGRSGIRLAPHQPVISSASFLKELAVRTGGESLSSGTGGLRKTFERIVTEFRSRYLLSYAPKGVDAAGWHPIEVKVKGRRATVTARRGYQR